MECRVDYTGLSTINSQRFGQKFVGKVANPQDVLHWHKAASKKIAKVNPPPLPFHSMALRISGRGWIYVVTAVM
jgi:hypothetical protein